MAVGKAQKCQKWNRSLHPGKGKIHEKYSGEGLADIRNSDLAVDREDEEKVNRESPGRNGREQDKSGSNTGYKPQDAFQ